MWKKNYSILVKMLGVGPKTGAKQIVKIMPFFLVINVLKIIDSMLDMPPFLLGN